MSVRREKLALALELARQKIEHSGTGIERVTPKKDSNSETSNSKLNRLLGKSDVIDRRQGTLLQRTGIVERPTFDLVADGVLGKQSKQRKPAIELQSNGDSLADIAARRIRSLRQRTFESIEQQIDPVEDTYLGMEHDGSPVWKSVLDGHRGRATHAPSEELAPPEETSPFHHSVVLPAGGAWPLRLRPEVRKSFKQWFNVPENTRATQAADAVVDSPGGQLNPLLFIGASQTGRTHLLHATAQAVLRRQEGDVYMLTSAELSGLERLPDGWQDTLVNARLLAIDDIDSSVAHPELAHELGLMIDYALNLGVHVLLTSKSTPDDWPTSRLWELTRHAASVHLEAPQSSSMILYARHLAIKKGLMMNDSQLASLVLKDTIGWQSTKANFDLVALALQSGDEVLDGEDVTALLSNQLKRTTADQSLQREKVEDIAMRLINTAVDTVYSDEVHGGIDLYSKLPEIGDDEYMPPELDAQELAASGQRRHAEYLKIALEDTAPAAPSVLDLNEREQHLIARQGRIEERDYGLAADVLTELDEAFDHRINSFERDLIESSIQLGNLESQLHDLSERTSEASIEELIRIADELREMESNLTEFDPDREPWPEMEEDNVRKERRKANRRKSSKVVDPLDSHEPDGEWNVDSGSVDMMDLLSDSQQPRKIRLGRIRPVQTMKMGEEE